MYVCYSSVVGLVYIPVCHICEFVCFVSDNIFKDMILSFFVAMDVKNWSVENTIEIKYSTEIASALEEIQIPLLA